MLATCWQKLLFAECLSIRQQRICDNLDAGAKSVWKDMISQNYETESTKKLQSRFESIHNALTPTLVQLQTVWVVLKLTVTQSVKYSVAPYKSPNKNLVTTWALCRERVFNVWCAWLPVVSHASSFWGFCVQQMLKNHYTVGQSHAIQNFWPMS